MGELADAIQGADIVETAALPGWPKSTVEGHKGRIVIGTLDGVTILVLQGRVHFYEGYPIQDVVFPVRVMHKIGIQTLIVTNAAGGLNKSYAVGDLMLIQDHINFYGLAGNNPLVGPNDPALGPRFPDMTTAYDNDLRAIARHVASEHNLTLREGVYCAVAGPSYETPAEIRMLRAVGGDAVGMSTAPEVVAARHCGMRVIGFSGISNMCHDSNDPKLTVNHQEVMEVGRTKIIPALTVLLRGIIAALG
jgi:purine-nucleoside phosphorylase